jgi:hypothetical protein
MKNEEFATAQRPEDNTPAKSEAEVETKVEAEAPAITEAAVPTPSPLAQMQAELEALRRENARLQAERELQRQLHHSRPRRVSDGQRPDIDRHTDEPAQSATARSKPTDRRWLKPLALAAASVVACIVIYETGLLIPMGLIGLATSGLVK